MKLLYCGECSDIILLQLDKRECMCGKTSGSYFEDGLHAWYVGEHAVPLGIANNSFVGAKAARGLLEDYGTGMPFTAFVIPSKCHTFERID